MENREGVIKFILHYTEEDCITTDMIAEISGWRYVLHRLQLIGQDPERYQGLGFGNISVRYGESADSFIVTGTQTGKAPWLQRGEYSLVTGCDPQHNALTARGPCKPSSEALTHGQLYQLDGSINCVVHAHSPEIWRQRVPLRLPATANDVPYGTPQMAQEVEKLFRETDVAKRGVFVMGGHEDGVVSFGRTITQASGNMISALASAVSLLQGKAGG